MYNKVAWVGLVAALAWTSNAWSADPAAKSDAVDLGEDEPSAADDEFTQKTDAEDDLSEPAAPPAEAAPVEEEFDPDAWQVTLGVRYRLMVVPKFLINAFGVDGGTTVVANGVGPEIGFSKKSYEFMLAGWYSHYPMSDTPFKAPNDPPTAWEVWSSNASVFYITADVTLKQEIAKGWDWTVGASGGIGIVFGNMNRHEAYWTNPDGTTNYSDANPTGDPYKNLAACTAPGIGAPGVANNDCELNGDYSSTAPWPVYPWLSFQTGIRYQPVRNFIARLDLGAGSSGFWLGLGADYGL